MGLQIKERDRDRIVLGVESNISQGRVITVTVDNESLNLTNPDRLRLRIDGNAIERATNIDELFAGGTRPLCYLMTLRMLRSTISHEMRQDYVRTAISRGNDRRGVLYRHGARALH